MLKRRPVLLRLPNPWGHQPVDPADSPFSVLLEQTLGHGLCLAGYQRNPPRPCLLGERAECVWGVRDRESFFCAWKFIKRYQDGTQLGDVARALGLSVERARHYLQLAATAVKSQKNLKELLFDEVESGTDANGELELELEEFNFDPGPDIPKGSGAGL